MVGEAAGGGGEAEGVPGGEGGVPAARVQEVGRGHLASHDSDVRPWCTLIGGDGKFPPEIGTLL